MNLPPVVVSNMTSARDQNRSCVQFIQKRVNMTLSMKINSDSGRDVNSSFLKQNLQDHTLEFLQTLHMIGKPKPIKRLITSYAKQSRSGNGIVHN